MKPDKASTAAIVTAAGNVIALVIVGVIGVASYITYSYLYSYFYGG